MIIVYRRAPGPLNSLIDGFTLLINELPTQHRILIVGDFNLYQMLPMNVAKIDPLIQNFNLSQRSQYSIHIHEGLLDFAYYDLNSKLFLLYHHLTVVTVSFFSKSDHCIYIEFSGKQFSFLSSLHNL